MANSSALLEMSQRRGTSRRVFVIRRRHCWIGAGDGLHQRVRLERYIAPPAEAALDNTKLRRPGAYTTPSATARLQPGLIVGPITYPIHDFGATARRATRLDGRWARRYVGQNRFLGRESMDFLAKVVLNLLRSLFLFNQSTEKNTDSCTKAVRERNTTTLHTASRKIWWTGTSILI